MPKIKLKTEYSFDVGPHENTLLSILKEIQKNSCGELDHFNYSSLRKILVRYPYEGNKFFRQSHLIAGYRKFVEEKKLDTNEKLIKLLQMKPMRTQSGVAPVTVLTKPFPCPGKCIFCPNDVRMPKSYLASEPGAQRAQRNKFDPYLQTYNRLLAFHAIGHSVEKVELLILGGTWSFYPEFYQIWFVKRCFDAMNDFPDRDRRDEIHAENIFEKGNHTGGKKSYNQLVSEIAGGNIRGFFKKYEQATWRELEEAHSKNETAYSRNVGLVIETRPDSIHEKEVVKVRRLGATKVQIGIQSLRDSVMKLNKRGHGQRETKRAIALLRLMGFKIHGHWMPNLYGATAKTDIEDYQKLWKKDYAPDELKIYPTSIIERTELFDIFKKGKFRPYSYEELLHVLVNTIPRTPRYARLSRIIRDFPSTDIVEGNKYTNFRQIAEKKILASGTKLEDIRSREVKHIRLTFKELEFEKIFYQTSVSDEYFLSYKTKINDKIAGFLRLSLPKNTLSKNHFFKELRECAIIREVHVYGQVVGLGKHSDGYIQHLGLGTKLITISESVAKNFGFQKIAVISAVGTREYYRKRGFHDTGLYLVKNI